MNRRPAQLYLNYPSGAARLLTRRLEEGLLAGGRQNPVTVFFRADDIGVPSGSFTLLLECFKRSGMPLCLAVVPAWLSNSRWSAIIRDCDPADSLWCWHQHGWKHRNYETSGKNCEFGPSRPQESIRHDLQRGRERLRDIIGPWFSPYFTPPWNRCSAATLGLLKDMGYHGLSRSSGAQPPSFPALPDYAVNVDLHTRKEPDSAACLARLADELSRAAQAGRIGIMIHHQRMNEAAFRLLEQLLDFVATHDRLRPVRFNELTGSGSYRPPSPRL